MATATFLYIGAIQSPAPFMVDDRERSVWTVNFKARAVGDVDLLTEIIANRLVGQSLGTLNVDLYLGDIANIPAGGGPYTTIVRTSGSAPDHYRGDEASRIENLTFQVVTRARSHLAAEQKIIAIERALDGLSNITLSSS